MSSLKLVEEYLARKTVKRPQPKKVGPQAVTLTNPLAIAVATKVSKMATAALIIAIGAMLAAITAGLVAIETLQH